MRETLEFFAAATGFVGLTLVRSTWWLIKLAVLGAVLVGAATNVLDLTPRLWPPFEFNFDGLLTYSKLGFATAADAWWILALALVLVWMLGVRNEVRKIETHASQSKIALVALANYFEIDVETEGMKIYRDEGLRGILRRGLSDRFVTTIFGVDLGVGDELTAKPVREAMSVAFRDDLRQAFDKDS